MNIRSIPVPPTFEGTGPIPGFPGCTYTVGRVAATEKIRQLVAEQPVLALDIETFGLGKDALDIKCVQMGTAHEAVVLDPRDPAQRHEIASALARAESLVLHNSPFDAPSLYANGLLLMDSVAKITDTLIYARMANPSDFGGNGLLQCASRYLGTSDKNQLEAAFNALGMNRTDGYRKFDIDRPNYVMGAATDVILTARLHPKVLVAAHRQLTSGHPYARYGLDSAGATELIEREQKINRLMLRRSLRGLRVDLEFLDRYRAMNTREIEEAATELHEEGIRPGIGPDLMKRLTALGFELPEDYPLTGRLKNPSTAAPALQLLGHPLARTFVRHKKLAKVEKDYLAKVVDLADDNDLIHPQVNVLGANATGRMSYGSPPLQQFPEAARGIILADPGDSMVSVDWSQIEPVVAANIARDTARLDVYEGGGDFYEGVAAAASITRKQAKVVILALMYGEGLAKLAASLGISETDAQELKDAVFASMPQTSEMLTKLRRVGGDYRCVFTMSGRILPVPLGKYDGRWSVMRHKAVNYFVQGSAYDLMACALVAVAEAGLGDALYLSMHDELVVSKDAAHDVQRIMATPPERLVWLAGRTPVLRTDVKELGERWDVA